MNPSPVVAAVDALWALDGAGSQPAGRGDAEPGRRRGAEPRWQRRHADRPGGPWCSGARCAVAHLNLSMDLASTGGSMMIGGTSARVTLQGPGTGMGGVESGSWIALF